MVCRSVVLFLSFVLLSFVILGAASAQEEATPRTRVAVLGMIHGRHPSSSTWGLSQVKETVRRFKPDAVLAEIPPDRWEHVWPEFERTQVVTDARVKRFPEYTDALLHLSLEMGFPIEPCAAWTRPMADHRREKIREFETSEAFAEKHQEYQSRLEAVQARYSDSLDVTDDPWFIHSNEYDRRMKEELSLYDEYLNVWIGEGGWTNINQAHMGLIDRAITKNAGKRLLITFGSGHKYWFLEKLSQREDVELISILPYLPPRDSNERAENSIGELATMDDQCQKEVLELHQFFEDWFLARVDPTDEVYSRFQDVMSDGFEMIAPEGTKTARDEMLGGLRSAHGVYRGREFSIEVRGYRGRDIGAGLHLVTYEEWQETEGVKKGRLSSAVFRRRQDAPNGVEWLHLHETMIQEEP